jgi:hypothetical protein
VFFHKDNPSQRPWSHVQLFEGHNIKLPPECTTEQTWTFEIESEKAFVPDPIGEDVIQRDEWVDWSDGNSEDLLYLTLATHLMKPNEHTRRLCVLSFLSFDTDQAEARYRQHLDAVSEDSELGMRAQVCGQVGHNQQDLSIHAKMPAGKKHQKKTKKWQPLNVSTDGPARIARPVNTEPGDLWRSGPAPTLFSLISFPSPKEFGRYLIGAERHSYQEATKHDVHEGMIMTKHLVLPSKDQPILSGDSNTEIPYAPHGHDQ